jgi:hypothetical protein
MEAPLTVVTTLMAALTRPPTQAARMRAVTE